MLLVAGLDCMIRQATVCQLCKVVGLVLHFLFKSHGEAAVRNFQCFGAAAVIFGYTVGSFVPEDLKMQEGTYV